jgi:hypothetical protein
MSLRYRLPPCDHDANCSPLDKLLLAKTGDSLLLLAFA